MKVSVIVPVYNCEEFLTGCLDSILNQTYQNLEIILVDDGSKDGSGGICDSYAQRDSRVRVIHQMNQGVSAARNAGLEAATGDVITFVDSDDAVESDIYEVLVKLAQEHDADIAHCGYRKIHFDGSTKDVLGTGVLLIQDSWEASRCLLTGQHFTGSPCTKLYRRELFADIRFDPSLKINEDVWMNVQIFRKARKLVFWDVPKYRYYEREQSATRVTKRLKIKRDCVEAAQRMLDLYRDTQLEGACAAKLHYALLDLYRTGLLCDYSGEKSARKEIHKRMKEIPGLSEAAPARSIWNYRFMHYLPWLYVLVYRVFDRIRKPNIDL